MGAWKIATYPSVNACWLMNADPSSSFGKHMIVQAREMVDAYPDAASWFWDVYGRSYMFDFAHDDGITMVNNEPAYYPEFMYQGLMRQCVRPLLRSRGMLITANKPVSIASCPGLDGIISVENAPREDSPAWITAQRYLGLNRHTMILEGKVDNAEMMYLRHLQNSWRKLSNCGPRWGGSPGPLRDGHVPPKNRSGDRFADLAVRPTVSKQLRLGFWRAGVTNSASGSMDLHCLRYGMFDTGFGNRPGARAAACVPALHRQVPRQEMGLPSAGAGTSTKYGGQHLPAE